MDMISSSRKAFILLGDTWGGGASRYVYLLTSLRAYPNDSEDARSRFSTINNMEMSCKKIVVHDIVPWILYIFSDGSSLRLLKSMSRMHKTTNRSVLTYLFATYCFVGLEFGLLTTLFRIDPLRLRICRLCGGRNIALQFINAKLNFGVSIFRSFCVSNQIAWQVATPNYSLNGTKPGENQDL